MKRRTTPLCSWTTAFADYVRVYPPQGGSKIYEFRPISGPPVTHKFSRNQKSKRKIKICFQNSFEVAKMSLFIAKPLKNAKNTPLCSVLIFDFNSNENQNLFKNSKISKIRRYKERRNNATTQRRYKETKIQRKGEKFMSIKEH